MPKIIKLQAARGECVTDFERAALEEMAGAEGADPASILAQAREEAEAKVREAYAEGMRRGMESGEQKFRESVGESARLLQEAAGRLERARQEFLDELEPQLIQLATSIAQRILDREARLSPDVLKRTARTVLQKVMDEEHVVLQVNPRDLDALRAHRVELLEQFDGISRLDIVPDESIDPGGCIAQTETLRVDGRIASQLERILNDLLE